MALPDAVSFSLTPSPSSSTGVYYIPHLQPGPLREGSSEESPAGLLTLCQEKASHTFQVLDSTFQRGRSIEARTGPESIRFSEILKISYLLFPLPPTSREKSRNVLCSGDFLFPYCFLQKLFSGCIYTESYYYISPKETKIEEASSPTTGHRVILSYL